MQLTLIRRFVLAAGLALIATGAPAQDYPSMPITLMVGLAAGGITDITARLYAEAVSKSIGQRVTVENKTGRGRRRRRGGGAERDAGRLHAAGVLGLATRDGAGGQQRAPTIR